MERIGRINAFLKRTFKYGFCSEILTFSDFAHDADLTLFSNMIKKQYSLHSRYQNQLSTHLTQKKHVHDLPGCTLELQENHFYHDACFKFIQVSLHCVLYALYLTNSCYCV